MLVSFQRAFALVAVMGLGGSICAAQDKQPQWKDRAEYDLVESINKEQNPQTKMGLINQWKEKYPASEFKDFRFDLTVSTYQAMQNGKGMMDAAKEWAAANPKAVKAYYWINLLTISLNDTSPAALDAGEKAANGLLGLMDDTFSPARKPEKVSDADWKKERGNTEYVAYRTLGWVNWQRQKFEDSEKALIETLKRNPADAQASLWCGTVIARQRKLEKQGAALYHFARASVYDGPGSFPQQTRDQVKASFEKNYVNFHGDKGGMDEIYAKAKTEALPPEGFKIDSKDEILLKQEEELKKTNPTLALWISIKRELAGQGAAYFDGTLKNAHIPGGAEVGGTKVEKFKGKVVSCDAPKKAKKVVLGISSAGMSEVTLNLPAPIAACPDPGTDIEFAGVPVEYTPEPFNLTFDVEAENVSGLPAAPPPAKKSGAPAKKAAPKK